MLKKVGIFSCAIALLSIAGSYANAGLIGLPVLLSTNGNYSRFADIAFDTVDNKYLVIYTDYSAPFAARVCGRFVSAAGAPIGLELCITETSGGLYGSVAYNPVSNLFLVTWDDQRASPNPIWGQLVSGATGALVGVNFQIGSAGGIRSAVAASTTANTFLVVWQGTSLHVWGQRVSSLGTLIGANFNISNSPGWYPANGYAASGDQFLATWDEETGHIYGQRINAVTGAFLGGQINITPSSTTEDRSAITYDTVNARWMVVFNDTSTPGESYNQGGQIVTTSGALLGSKIFFASSAKFEGDTNYGGDIGFVPGAGGRYFASFATAVSGIDVGAAGQEALPSGLLVNNQITVDTGSITSSSNAGDPNSNHWLLIWEKDVAGIYTVFGQLFEPADLTPPGLVTNFNTTQGSGQLTLHWTNPADSDFAGTVIRWKLGSYPAHIADGTFLVDQPNTPGSNDSYVHMGLTGGTTYFYSAFTYDQVAPNPNRSSGAHASGVPATYGDFDLDTDVDQKDFSHLQNCFSGPAVPYAPGCSDADFDIDGDVDSVDFATFDGCMKGPNQTPGC